MQLQLTPTQPADLEFFFQFQLDEQVNYLAAFTPKCPTDKKAYFDKFTKLLNDPTIHMQTILVEGVVAGSIAKFELEGGAEITYWLDRRFWGEELLPQPSGTCWLSKMSDLFRGKSRLTTPARRRYWRTVVL